MSYGINFEKAVKNSKHVMLFWESKLIHKLRGKTYIPSLYYIGTDKTNEKTLLRVNAEFVWQNLTIFLN